jgi:hypothetical protein
MILAMAERGGLYCSFFRNSLVFCHFVRKTPIFCRLRPSLSSRIRLSSALQSLLWTSKVPKKSNISNKSGFPFWVCFHCRGLECGKSSANFPGVADRIASLGTLPGPSTVACRATRVQIKASSNIQTTWLARRESPLRSRPRSPKVFSNEDHDCRALANVNAFEFLGVTGTHWARHCLCARWRFGEMNCQDL